MSELHETLVENGNFAKTEEYVEQFASDGLIDCTKQPYKATWSVQDQLRNPGMKPDMRVGHQLVLDSNENRIYLFGGWDGFCDLSDLWYYDIKLNQWTLIHERAELNNGPCPRSCHKMIFDPAKSQIFTLGRYVDNVTRTNFNITSDFYLYNVRTNSWLLISKDTSQVGGPFPLLDHQMCIDVAENTIYVFGGRILTQRNIQDLSKDPQYSGLYSYHIDVNMWRQILVDCNHPSASNPDVYSIKSRATHSMLFHHRYRKLYVFAGQRNKEYTPEFISIDLDSRAITVMSSDCENMPQCGFTQRATIDCERDEIYVHTSLSKEKERKDINFNVLWMFSLKTNQWSCIYRRNHSKLQCLTKLDRSCTEPCPRFAHQLIYDVNSKIHFLFGGNPGNNSQVLQHYKFLIRKLEYEEIARVDPLQAMCYLQTSLSDVVDHSDSEQLKQFHKLPTLLFNNEPPQCASFSSTPMCSSPDLENSSSSSQSHHYNHCCSKICCFGKTSPPSSDSDECRLNNYEGLWDHKVKRCVLFNKIVKLLPDHMLQPKGNLSDFWTLIHERAELNNGPCPRSCHKMIFDPAKSQIFTLGRYVDNVTRTNFNITSDFYLYNVRTNSWLLISKDTSQVGGPFPLLDHQMCIDVAENTIYVFGGRILTQRNIQDLSKDPHYSGLYSYHIDVNMWRQILVDCNHPSASNPDVYSIKSRATHSMLFHHRYRKLYVFAGQRNKEYTPEFISIDLDSRAITVMSSDCENMPQCGFTQRATIDCERDEIYVHTSLSKEKERKDINFNVLWMFSLKTNQWSCIYRHPDPQHSKSFNIINF
ncbi:Muskelin [Pseudolycoriella hygida]|uniref:Muskelin n=1 Tax=Pseudolycoriella hygida TaxID=35572 RepID=A0A9Q0MKP9_9DIPT|nr:Muskelin [Pseudolycoriella hygida]